MFGIIALLVIQAAINVGLLLTIRRTDREVYEIKATIDRIIYNMSGQRELLDKLTYKP